MADKFAKQYSSVIGPMAEAFAITPNNSNDFAQTTRSLYVGGAGNVAIMSASGANTTFVAVPVGTVLPIRAQRVLFTGTTATNLVGMY